jgi:hypothetical protein
MIDEAKGRGRQRESGEPEAPNRSGWPPGFNRDDHYQALSRNAFALSALYVRWAPQHPPGGHDFETMGLGYLARAHHAFETILQIPQREVDCCVLARTLYEHVVAFSWLAIDPEPHRRMLLRWEYNERRKWLNDPHTFQLLDPPDDGIVRRALIDMADTAAPETPDRAFAADKYWPRCNIGWPWQFRRSYSHLFRFFSCYVHPTVVGIDPFVERGDPPTVGRARAVFDEEIRGEAAVCFADALAVASFRLGWPSMDDLLAITTHGLQRDENA